MFRQLAVVCFIAVVFGEDKDSDKKAAFAALPMCGKSDFVSMASRMPQGGDSTFNDCLKQCPTPAAVSQSPRGAAPAGVDTKCLMKTGMEALNGLSKCVKDKGLNDFPNATEIMQFVAQHMQDFKPAPLCSEAQTCLKNAMASAARAAHNTARVMPTCNIMATKNAICGCGKDLVEQYKSQFASCVTNTSGPNVFDQYTDVFKHVCEDGGHGPAPAERSQA